MAQKQIKGVNFPKTKLGISRMNKISSSARTLFFQKGFFDTGINEICDNANIAVGTFYIYFEDKTALYRYIIEVLLAEINETINNVLLIKDCVDRRTRESEGIKQFIRYVLKNPDIFEIIWGGFAIDPNAVTYYYNLFSDTYTNDLKKCKRQLIEGADCSDLSYILMGLSCFMAFKALFKKMSEEEIDDYVDNKIMPIISNGMFKPLERNC